MLNVFFLSGDKVSPLSGSMRFGLHCCGLCQGDFYLLHRLTYGFVAKFVVFCLVCVGFLAVGVIIIEKSVLHKLDPDPSDHPSAKKRLPPSAVVMGTDVDDLSLHYGVVVDCGSSGSRVFVYVWPPHDGIPNELLHIEQMKDKEGQLVMKKIEPGISSFVNNPSEVSEYLEPLLRTAAAHVPAEKHKETPLYIMATAGMRMLSEREQEAILNDLEVDIPMAVDFLFTKTHMEVISGKQEGIYAWIGLNYVLGRFDHYHRAGDPVVEVEIPGPEHQRHLRKRTVGIVDMGGASLQVAFEVPKSEALSQNLLAEFNLGCSNSDLDHSYRVYVTTFLGYGANVARSRYEEQLLDGSLSARANSSQKVSSQSQMQSTAINKDLVEDPCLPLDMVDQVTSRGHTYTVKGTGLYSECRDTLKPLLNQTNPCSMEPCTINGVFQPSVNYDNSEFYGFSEFYYSMEDLLRIGGKYERAEFEREAKDYCATRWSTLQSWYQKQLFPRANEKRFKYQCFKSAWMSAVLHQGLHFPDFYKHFTSAQLIDGREVQWTLGALLYKTRYFPLREIEKHASSQHQYRPSWIKEVSNSYHLLLLCFFIVVAAILIYLRRLRLVRRPDLRRVPTMSYFMTEEDQMEEGVLLDTQAFPVSLS